MASIAVNDQAICILCKASRLIGLAPGVDPTKQLNYPEAMGMEDQQEWAEAFGAECEGCLTHGTPEIEPAGSKSVGYNHQDRTKVKAQSLWQEEGLLRGERRSTKDGPTFPEWRILSCCVEGCQSVVARGNHGQV